MAIRKTHYGPGLKNCNVTLRVRLELLRPGHHCNRRQPGVPSQSFRQCSTVINSNMTLLIQNAGGSICSKFHLIDLLISDRERGLHSPPSSRAGPGSCDAALAARGSNHSKLAVDAILSSGGFGLSSYAADTMSHTQSHNYLKMTTEELQKFLSSGPTVLGVGIKSQPVRKKS